MLRNYLQRRLRMEILEDKRPLAANLFVSVVNGDLIVTGDAGDNRFYLESGAPAGEQYEFGNLGAPGDTINGIPFDRDHYFSGVTGDIIINLGDGSDWANITGTNGVDVLNMPGDLRMNLGNGDDRIALGVAEAPLRDQPIPPAALPLDIAGDMVVNMGAGTDMSWITAVTVGDDFQYTDSQGDAFLEFVPKSNDLIDGMESDFGDDFSVITGGGADQISVEDINVDGDLLVTIAGGDDFVKLANVEVAGSTLASLGAGVNQAEFESSNLGSSLTVLGSGSNVVLISNVVTSNSVVVLTSNGNDAILLGGVQTGTAIVSTGSGADELLVVDSVFDNLLVTLGGGNDTLTIGGTTVNGLALLLGGGGFDTYVDAGGNDITMELDMGFEAMVS